MSIVANDFRIDRFDEHAEISCALKGEDFPERLRFSVPVEDVDAIDVDEPNWAALSLYWQAMMLGQDLVIEADLSPVLLYNMRYDLMGLMRNYEPLLRDVHIDAGETSPSVADATRDVMTGFSAGVDSFSTFLLHTHNDVPKKLRLTALSVFQVGALGPTSQGNGLLAPAVDHIRAHAKRNGLKVYSVDSNMNEVFEPASRVGPIDFRRTVGLRNAAAAMVLQNGIQTYLPSGSVGYKSATYGPHSCTENMDPVFQPLLSTEKLFVKPAGARLTRTDKIKLLADNPDAHSLLNVCVSGGRKPNPKGKVNCSRCWKCVQTLMVLEAIDKLDAFDAVFDLEHYRSNRKQLLLDLQDYAHQNNAHGMLGEIEYVREQGVNIPRRPSHIEKKLRRVARRVGVLTY